MKSKLGSASHAVTAVTAVIGAVSLLIVALDWRSPASPEWRYWLLGGLLSASFLLVWLGAFLARRQRRWIEWVGRFVGLVALSSVASLVILEGRFQWMRYQVISTDPKELEAIGNHLIVGYTDIDELRMLVEKRAVGGVFITARNVRGKSIDTISAEIEELQKQRVSLGAGIPKLWVAADQEGGIVSRLAPPLTRLPPLSQVVMSNIDRAQRADAVEKYARIHASELKRVGVNLNFAPVVDVNHGIINPTDKYTRIYQRAIAGSPLQIAEVARIYCGELAHAGIHCTAKHFPGLGRVFNDTHRENAALTTSAEELEQTDWIPFRELAKNPRFAIMLAHVQLTAIDPLNPVSSSEPVISGILRGQWHFDGMLITDDFTMDAIYHADGGMGRAAVNALNAGVDLILVSFDPDQCFPVIYKLLEARREGRLDLSRLESSRLRLLRQQPSESPGLKGVE